MGVVGAGPRPEYAATTTARDGIVPRGRGAKGVTDHGDEAVRWESAV